MLYEGLEQSLLFYGGLGLIVFICSIGGLVWLINRFLKEEGEE
jgi:hypothetical protein